MDSHLNTKFNGQLCLGDGKSVTNYIAPISTVVFKRHQMQQPCFVCGSCFWFSASIRWHVSMMLFALVKNRENLIVLLLNRNLEEYLGQRYS